MQAFSGKRGSRASSRSIAAFRERQLADVRLDLGPLTVVRDRDERAVAVPASRAVASTQTAASVPSTSITRTW
jgi:hypothetical protein